MAAIVVDTRQWPVVQAVWDGEQTDADVDNYIQEILRIYARREPFVTITWMKKYSASSENRKRITGLMHESEADVRRYSVCSAIIAPSAGFRFVMSTVLLVKRMVTPYRVCATFAEATSFCKEEAYKRKLTLPPEILPLCRE